MTDRRDPSDRFQYENVQAIIQDHVGQLKHVHAQELRDDRVGDNEDTYLHLAAHHDAELCAEFLVEIGLSVITLNKSGKTPLDIARENKSRCFLKLYEKMRDDLKASLRKNVSSCLKPDWSLKKHFTEEEFKRMQMSVLDSVLREDDVRWLQTDIPVTTTKIDFLILAAKYDAVRWAEFLIELGLSVITLNKSGKTPLDIARENKSRGFLKLYEKMRDDLKASLRKNVSSWYKPDPSLKKHFTEEQFKRMQASVLDLVFREDDAGWLAVHVPQQLLQDRMGDNHDTYLHLAAQKDAPKLAEALIKIGLSVITLNKSGKTPLDIARENKFHGFLKLYEKMRDDLKASLRKNVSSWYKPDPSLKKHFTEEQFKRIHASVLDSVFREDDVGWFEGGAWLYTALLKDRVGDNKDTYLHLAAHHDAELCAEFLIELGLSVITLNKSGKTPLDIARENKSRGFLKLYEKMRDDLKASLRKHISNWYKPDPSLKKYFTVDEFSQMRISIQTSVFREDDVGWFRGDVKSIVTKEATDKNTFLHLAAAANAPKIAEVLIGMGLSLISRRVDGKTPLDIARENKSHAFLKLANENIQREYLGKQFPNWAFPAEIWIRHLTADELHDMKVSVVHSTIKGDEVKWLKGMTKKRVDERFFGYGSLWVQHGAPNYERTLLHLAAEYNAVLFAKELIDIGADLDVKDELDRTAVDIALANNNEDVGTLINLHIGLERDWFSLDTLTWTSRLTHLLGEDYLKEQKIQYVQKWVADHHSIEQDVDEQQAEAIGEMSTSVVVKARAGSGKTGTLVNRVVFLIEHCGIEPHEILVLVFNNKAMKEIKGRLDQILPQQHNAGPGPFVRTFHALAKQIDQTKETLLYDNQEQGDKRLSTFIEEQLIDPLIPGSVRYEKVKKLMLKVFKEEIELIRLSSKKYTQSKDKYLSDRRQSTVSGSDGSYHPIGLDATWYKSEGERAIGNFLFEHDFDYGYEKSVSWHSGGKRTVYRPDFMITGSNQDTQNTGFENGNRKFQKQIVIEYFGMAGDSAEYDLQIQDKRNFWRLPDKQKYHFAEIGRLPDDEDLNDFITNELSKIFNELGITYTKLSEEEIWSKIKVQVLSDFAEQFSKFVLNARLKNLDHSGLKKLIDEHEDQHHLAVSSGSAEIPEAETLFLCTAAELYGEYFQKLTEHNSIDWPGVLVRAQKKISDGDTIFAKGSITGDLRNIKHLIIDEYQDFSELYLGMVNAIRKHKPDARLFAVGDDWQAINGFAGADLKFFRNPETHFGKTRILDITTNYRSDKSIVKVGNTIMKGMGKEAHPVENKSEGSVEIADYSKGLNYNLAEDSVFQEYGMPIPALLRLISRHLDTDEDQRVVVLTRVNQPRGIWGKDGNWVSKFKNLLTDDHKSRTEISTTHKYKGLEELSVIILDSDRYPLIHPYWVFQCVLGKDVEEIEQEERRLFYVAATRAESNLTIMITGDGISTFVASLKSDMNIPFVEWDALQHYPYSYSDSDSQNLLVKVMNADGLRLPTWRIKGGLNDAKYDFKKQVPPHKSFWYKKVTSYSSEAQVWEDIKRQHWFGEARKIDVLIERSNGESVARYHVDGNGDIDDLL
jgi:DNA helicase-4